MVLKTAQDRGISPRQSLQAQSSRGSTTGAPSPPPSRAGVGAGAWVHRLLGDAGTEKWVFLLVDAQAPSDVLDRDILDEASTPALHWAFIK